VTADDRNAYEGSRPQATGPDECKGDEGAVRLGIRQASGVAATSSDHIPDHRGLIWRSDRRDREQARRRRAP
jgi:hypothetical protein